MARPVSNEFRNRTRFFMAKNLYNIWYLIPLDYKDQWQKKDVQKLDPPKYAKLINPSSVDFCDPRIEDES